MKYETPKIIELGSIADLTRDKHSGKDKDKDKDKDKRTFPGIS